MAEYIDVDKLIDKINSRIKNTLIRGWLASIINETIIEQSTADVAEVKHGRWELFATDCVGKAFNCSLCGHIETTEEFEKTPLDNGCNYCSHCGAKMDGGKME